MSVFDSADLWFPGRQDPLGWPLGLTVRRPGNLTPDPSRYIIWVDPGRPGDELAPRQALHVQVSP
jgi:hypothetical protein